ncbi:ABC transporter ATP-binding protein [Halobacillus sp. B23F22_1]|uniref:ABC transporter ATP-binding protein n=1 Tax=Halobacillus sp. B23F22_1 TaxID=3459514 RepID=UPI00373F0A86
MDIQSVLKVSNCHITIRDAAILSEVTFEVKQGRITALVGHNGAGKSTLMKAIIGSLEKREGTIIIGGVDQDEHLTEYKYQFSYIPEEPLLLNELTVFQHFQLYQKSYDIPDSLFIERIQTYAEAFELMDKLDNYPEELSKGMRQKAQTICALLPDVPLLLIDEPFMGLDVYAGIYLQQLLKQRRDEGTSILLTTHQLDKVHDLANDFVMLKEGRISSAGTIEQFEQLERRGSL